MKVPLNLDDKTVLVVGCGGLGCYVIEYLGRCNVGRLIIIDGDKFTESNMNRQLYCDDKTLNRYKVEVVEEELKKKSKSTVIAINGFFPSDWVDELKEDIDVIIDCLDNVKSRLKVEEFAASINVPLIHGAINGTTGQVTTIMPGDYTLKKLYSKPQGKIDKTLSFVPALVASLQVAEALKVLCNKPSLNKSILLIDVMDMNFRKVEI